MAKYKITYMSDRPAEVDDAVLTLVNQAPSPPPSSGSWTAYKHDGKTVLEISTADADAGLIITPPSGGALADQTAKAKLAVAAGQTTSFVWRSDSAGLKLEMNGSATSTTFDITDTGLPPQALKVTVKRPS